jgi:hypothetical protein
MANKRVSEAVPIQVYLGREEQSRLDRLAHELWLSKSEFLRRGLLALELEVLDPSSYPALRVIGMVSEAATRS